MLTTPDLILFAKKPVPGKVKTRLLTEFSPVRAAEIAAFCMRATAELAAANWPGEIFLYVTPDADHPVFKAIEDDLHVNVCIQGEGDLGDRMYSALRDSIENAGSAAVMGVDIPHCSPSIIEKAFDTLSTGENVIGPTHDGGYYFLGLNASVSPELFEGIQWGGEEVFQQTLLRADKLGIKFELMPILLDIDTPRDLWLASRNYQPLQNLLS